MRRLLTHWPIFIIGLVVLFLAFVNYRSGTILTGGDNLHPEFNFLLNIKRSLFASWQEYEGLGALGAMGHASDLVRQLMLWGMSPIIPTDLLRYTWTMLTLFVGTVGAYYLIRKILLSSRGTKVMRDSTGFLANARNDKEKPFVLRTMPFALLGALFYLLNLGTIQQYYTPFEVFTSHFAVLPWLFLTTINYFLHPNKKNVLLLSLTLLLATPHGYVPTLFVVWLMGTGILTLFLAIKKLKPLVINYKPLITFYVLVFVINAFWLLPFAYFTVTNVHVDLNAKINQMASENIYLMNKEYGHLPDVMLLRGFWFQNVEPDIEGNLRYMFLPWRTHYAQPLIQVLGYGIFAIIMIGIWHAVRSRRPLLLAFAGMFGLSILMLTTATPPFEQVNTVLRMVIPLFKEVFRFPFTKFSLLAGLVYAIFFAVGIKAMSTTLLKRFTIPLFPPIMLLLSACCIFILAYPAFRGNLFYTREQVVMPQAYKDLFSYMAHQDPSKRVALFPHHTFWDWKFYSWGYSGSGFLWYGLPQPVLDRAFDMWEMHNENYYHELSHALYSQNADDFSNTLQKYHVSYLLIDENVMHSPAPQALYFSELTSLIAKIPSIKQKKKFGNLTLYEVTLVDKPHHSVSLHSTLPRVNGYDWTDTDTAYGEYGTYSTNDHFTTAEQFYPFRSLFTGKTQENKAFTMEEKTNALEFSTVIPEITRQTQLKLPSLFETASVIPASIRLTKLNNGNTQFDLVIRTPEVWLGAKKLSGGEIIKQLQVVPRGQLSEQVLLNVNGVSQTPIVTTGTDDVTLFLSLKQENILVITDEKMKRTTTLLFNPSSLSTEPSLQERTILIPPSRHTQVFTLLVPKVADNNLSYIADITEIQINENCNIFRIGDTHTTLTTDNALGQLHVTASNATTCTSLYSPNLPHSEAYALFVSAEHKKGKGFHFWIANLDSKFVPIDTYLPANKKHYTSSFVLPPQEPHGSSYSFHFEGLSIGEEPTENILSGVRIFQIPYDYLLAVAFENKTPIKNTVYSEQLTVTHPNETLYVVTTGTASPQKSTLMLAQAYNPGWKLYEVTTDSFRTRYAPFIGGYEIQSHIRINTWANGWELSDAAGKTYVLVYLPQYLEYLGFLLLIGTGIMLLFFPKKA